MGVGGGWEMGKETISSGKGDIRRDILKGIGDREDGKWEWGWRMRVGERGRERV